LAIKKSLPTAWFDFSLQTIDMGGNAGKVLQTWLSRRRRLPGLWLPTAETACQRP
jgi:hypothetical protein